MHIFEVVKDPHGWSVRLGSTMTTPFRSRAIAIREAHSLCNALRRHGEVAVVVVDGDDGAAPGFHSRGYEPTVRRTWGAEL